MGSGTLFGKRLAMFRRRAGLSQAELGERVALSRSYISHFEAGRKLPDIEILERLASVLSVTQAELLGEREPRPSPEQQAMELVGEIARHAVGLQGVAVLFAGQAATAGTIPPGTDGRGPTVRVLTVWVGTRAPEEFLVVEALGDGLEAEGIRSGNWVLIDRARRPCGNEVVLVRAGQHQRLAYWHEHESWAEPPVLVGVYVTHWRPTPEERAAVRRERA